MIAGLGAASLGRQVVVTPDDLRATFLFEDCTDEQLLWLVDNGKAVGLPAGAELLRQGEVTNDFWVLVEGELRFSRSAGGRDLIINAVDRPGSWGGWLPVSDDRSPVSIRLLRESRLLLLSRGAMEHVLRKGFPIALHLINGLNWGVRNFEAVARQQEKMVAVGGLAAGLAHELNNPAAAAVRAASRLPEVSRERDAWALALGAHVTASQATAVLTTALEGGTRLPPTDPLARSDREDTVTAWLERHEVVDPHRLAPALVDAGLTARDLERVAAEVDGEALPAALGWLAASLAVDALAAEVARSASRVSRLVTAITDYADLDRAAEREIDVRMGISDTLAVLAQRLDGVIVSRDDDPALPRIWGGAAELNQVWTHLIENAADAVRALPPGERRVAIRTATDGDGVVIEVADNGPGIPPEIQGRIFEPFFTTKPVGGGTGLGLDTAYRVVVRLYGGDLRVASEPGDTRFTVRLPVGMPPEDDRGGEAGDPRAGLP